MPKALRPPQQKNYLFILEKYYLIDKNFFDFFIENVLMMSFNAMMETAVYRWPGAAMGELTALISLMNNPAVSTVNNK